MQAPGAMASLATYAQFCRLHLASRTDGNRSGRMALEAFQDSSLRIHGRVEDSHCLGQSLRCDRTLARGGGERPDRRVIAEVVLQVPFFVYARYEGNGLFARSKCPFNRNIHDIFVVGGPNAD